MKQIITRFNKCCECLHYLNEECKTLEDDNFKFKVAKGIHPKCPLPDVDDGWISVEDKWPKEHKFVLCQGEIGNCILYLANEENQIWRWKFSDKECKFDITHWQSLPKPPKGV